MLELNRNNAVVNKPYADVANFANYAEFAPLEVDSTFLENDLRHKRQSEEIAAYIYEKSIKGINIGPQLAPPTVQITDDDNDSASLKNLLAAVEHVKQTNTFSSETFQARLHAIEEHSQANKVEVARAWSAVEQAHAGVMVAKDEVEQANTMLLNLQANPKPVQADVDKAAAAANLALANVGAALNKLEASIDALPETVEKKYLDVIDNNANDFYALKQTLVQIHLTLKANKIAVMQGQADLYVKQQDTIMTKLNRKGDEITQSQEQKEIFMEVMKYFGMALGVALSAMAGGEAGAIGVIVSVGLIGGDMATDGAISAAVIEPILTPLMEGIQLIAEFYAEILTMFGMPEIGAVILSAAATIGSIIAGAVALGWAASSRIGQALGEAISEFAEWFAKAAMEKAMLVVAAVQASKSFAAEAVKVVVGAIVDSVKWVANIFKELGKLWDEVLEIMVGPDKIDRWHEWYLNFLREVQSTVMAMGVTVEGGLSTATAYTERDEKYLRADINMATAEHEIYTKSLEKVGETWAHQIKSLEVFIQLASRLEKHRAQAALASARGIAAAAA